MINFDNKSDVTVVITSCGRFDLLQKTIASFDQHNTYPIKNIIITEDSGNDEIHTMIPPHWTAHCHVIVNNTKLGQIKSIDLAYEHITTKYIFHCEDDWLFYRHGFIEESKAILEENNNILQVWLRDYHHDIKIHYPHHYPEEKYSLNDIIYYKVGSNNEDWRGFSFNPGLKRKVNYDEIKPYFCNKTSDDTESYLSKLYSSKHMFAVFLENSAVKHIGWNHRILSDSEKKKIQRNKNRKIQRKVIYIVIGFLFGFITCYLLV